MKTIPAPLTPDAWILHLFSSKAAREGGIIRRQIKDVERYAGREVFLKSVKNRGYPVVENAGQFVIFCNQQRIRRVV